MAKKKEVKTTSILNTVDMGLDIDDFLSAYINNEIVEEEALSTGIKPLDMLLGGGFTEGDMIVVYSPPGLGKTTLVLQVARNMIDLYGKRVLFIDIEAGIKNMLQSNNMVSYLKGGNFGFTDKIQTLGQLEKLLEGIIAKGNFDVIIIDSITNALDDSVLKRSVLDQMVASQAKTLTIFLQKFRLALRNAGITCLMVNQERVNINAGMFDKKTKAAGCQALHYQPDVTIHLTKDGKRKEGSDILVKKETSKGIEDICVGYFLTIKADKNRKGFSKVPVSCPLLHCRGISNKLFITDILKYKGYAKTAGAYVRTNVIDNSATDEKWSSYYKDGGWCIPSAKFAVWVSDNYDILEGILESNQEFVLVKDIEEKEEEI